MFLKVPCQLNLSFHNKFFAFVSLTYSITKIGKKKVLDYTKLIH